MECIVCTQLDCAVIHTQEEIKAVTPRQCYVCREPAINMFCEEPHTIEEIRNPKPSTAKEFRDALRILIAYDKLLHGDDLASTG